MVVNNTDADKKYSNQETSTRLRIGVYGAFLQHKLLKSIAELYDVEFEPIQNGDIGAHQFNIIFKSGNEILEKARESNSHFLIYCEQSGIGDDYTSGVVRFSDNDEVDIAFRSQQFFEADNVPMGVLESLPTDQVLATKSGQPFWTCRKTDNTTLYFSSISPQDLGPHEILRERFCRESFTHLIALLHFVDKASAKQKQTQNKTRQACIVIDDPSLYFPSYGYVDFAKLARQVVENKYHVAIATIPLDTWYVNPKVASIFRDSASHLSLLIHGNNHISLELACDRSLKRILGLAAQALRRFKRLEKNPVALAYSKIMEAPHGTLVDEASEALVSLGYEAALFTPSQFISKNRAKNYPASFGCGRAETFPNGLCAIPRLVMSDDWRLEIAIAAFFHQPIVLACHHQDFSEGIELMNEFMTYINKLGDIQWCNLSDIAKTQAECQIMGNILTIKMGGRLVECEVPEGINGLVIERPWVKEKLEPIGLYIGSHVIENLEANYRSGIIPWNQKAKTVLRIESPFPQPVSLEAVPEPGSVFMPIVRKLLVELRDRFQGCLSPGIFNSIRSVR